MNTTSTKNRATDADLYRHFENNGTPEVQEWLQKQVNQAETYFRNIPVREQLRRELTHLFAHDTYGTPYGRRGRYFFTKRSADQDMHVLYVQEGLGGTPRVLIDQNTLSEDKTVTLSGWAPTRDGKLMAYGLSKAGNDQSELHMTDVTTGRETCAEACRRASYKIIW